MVVSHVSVYIRRPMDQVWAYLTDVDNYLAWHPGTVKLAASNSMYKGSKITITTSGTGRLLNMVAEITESDGRSYFVGKSTQGPIDFTAKYQLTAVEGGTKVEMFARINAHAVLRLAESALQQTSETQNTADLQRLKRLLETSDKPTLVEG